MVWGEDAFILKDLEQYERTLKVKRKLYPHDLLAVAKIDFIDGQKYILGMAKALLNAPTTDSIGHAILFSPSDVNPIQPSMAKPDPSPRIPKP